MWEFMRRPALSGPKVLILDFGSGSLKVAMVQVDLAKRFGYVLGFAKRSYRNVELKLGQGLQHNEPPFDFELLVELVAEAAEEVFRSVKSKTKEVLLVLSGSFIRGEMAQWQINRQDAKSRLGESEFQELLVNSLRNFKEELAKREQDGQYAIINGMLQQIKLDGYVIANPVDFKGSRLELSSFLFLLSETHRKFWHEAISALKLQPHSIIPSIWATMRSQMRHALTGFGAIFIDIGGGSTDILLVRDSVVEVMRTIQSGAGQLTNGIAQIFKTDFDEAERFQSKYEQGLLDEASVRKIETGLRDLVVGHRQQIVETLKTIAGNTTLPPHIVLIGGGMRFGLFTRLLTQYSWADELPFTIKPQVEVLLASEIKDVIDLTKQMSGPEFVPLLAATRWVSRHYKTLSKAENFFEGAIKLMDD